MRYNRLKPTGPRRLWLIVGLIILGLILVGVLGLRQWYTTNLHPVSSSTAAKYFTVEPGTSVQQIGTKLHQEGLVRNSQAFITYVRSNDSHANLQAGTYSLSPSMSVQQIVKKMTKGDVAKNLLTILPAKRLDQVKETFAKAGYSQAEIDQAFNRASYADHPLLASLPAGASLEGYLYPDSFQKQVGTPASAIIRQSLDEMQRHLTADVVSGFAVQGLNTYQGVILASIVTQESDNPAYQPTIAQVFLTRLKQDMAFQSNVTANYAADLAGQARNVGIDSPYNTYLHKGLPPGPIGGTTVGALKAVAHPAPTDYLYFVAGDDDKVHFSHTAAEHEAAIAQFCHKKCSQ